MRYLTVLEVRGPTTIKVSAGLAPPGTFRIESGLAFATSKLLQSDSWPCPSIFKSSKQKIGKDSAHLLPSCKDLMVILYPPGYF